MELLTFYRMVLRLFRVTPIAMWFSPEKSNVRVWSCSNVLSNLSPSQMTACAGTVATKRGVQTTQPALFLSSDLAREGVTAGKAHRAKIEALAPPR
ncbi:hypothetical protein HQ563_03570 [bacterium]|nr:hypothetical protein [bacterium]